MDNLNLNIPEPTLDAVLKRYHVVNSMNVLRQLIVQVVTTLDWKHFLKLTYQLGAGVTGSNTTNVNIIITDVQGTNGVVRSRSSFITIIPTL
ncbi:MAG: hypothetical protein R2728_09875 [Chitinophagales bacterium]